MKAWEACKAIEEGKSVEVQEGEKWVDCSGDDTVIIGANYRFKPDPLTVWVVIAENGKVVEYTLSAARAHNLAGMVMGRRAAKCVEETNGPS